MKFRKRMSICLFTLTLVLSLAALPVLASDDGRDGVCPQCGQGQMVLTDTTYSEWEMTGKTPCIHNDPWALDEAQKRTVQSTYTCDACGYASTLSTEETRAVHRKE